MVIVEDMIMVLMIMIIHMMSHYHQLVHMMKINDSGDMLMVFIDDDKERTDINRRAVYYSIGKGESWSTPKQLDNDGTIDDYPDICEIGDDKLLVTWSSADKVLDDSAGIEEALSSLDIKAAFFDKNAMTFGKVEQLTHETENDYTADVLPHAAYDSKTDRVILYYTKTQYDDIDSIEEFGSDFTNNSVTAYLFYEDGKWCNDGSYYTEKDLKTIAPERRETFKKDWYGQRFLDLRTTSDQMSLAVDSTAIGYNGLGLFAWTVDNDHDLATENDRDIFMQIYEFDTNTFSHVIKLTNTSGTYTAPRFARSDSSTYLFFGTKDAEEEHGKIQYLNVSEIIKN